LIFLFLLWTNICFSISIFYHSYLFVIIIIIIIIIITTTTVLCTLHDSLNNTFYNLTAAP
jgi:hypothetical protein